MLSFKSVIQKLKRKKLNSDCHLGQINAIRIIDNNGNQVTHKNATAELMDIQVKIKELFPDFYCGGIHIDYELGKVEIKLFYR